MDHGQEYQKKPMSPVPVVRQSTGCSSELLFQNAVLVRIDDYFIVWLTLIHIPHIPAWSFHSLWAYLKYRKRKLHPHQEGQYFSALPYMDPLSRTHSSRFKLSGRCTKQIPFALWVQLFIELSQFHKDCAYFFFNKVGDSNDISLMQMWLEGEEVNIYFVSIFWNYINKC